VNPVWCSGCGNYGVLRAVQGALGELAVPPERVMGVMAFSGIGCSGRLSHYLNAYPLHGTHGRALPTATGAKAVRPELTVIVVSGDGDALGIGGGHIAHAARRNVDLTYLILDNHTYGLTKGQSSPTTPSGWSTRTSPYGVYEDPLATLPVLLASGVSFLARTSSLHLEEMTALIAEGIRHPGLALIYILSPCVTYPFLTPEELRRRLRPLAPDHDPQDRLRALQAGYCQDPLYTGVFFRERRPMLEERQRGEQERARGEAGVGAEVSLAGLLERFS
jgi:2-oxoglutarate ferredoxin oxidoreductase subunit beta